MVSVSESFCDTVGNSLCVLWQIVDVGLSSGHRFSADSRLKVSLPGSNQGDIFFWLPREQCIYFCLRSFARTWVKKASSPSAIDDSECLAGCQAPKGRRIVVKSVHIQQVQPGHGFSLSGPHKYAVFEEDPPANRQGWSLMRALLELSGIKVLLEYFYGH